MTTITISGSKELQAALKALGGDIARVTKDALNATGLELRGDIVKRYQRGPKTGRIYKRGNVTHQASAPGQAPATDTGRLVGSVIFSVVNPTTVSVGSALAYATYLEFGTRHIARRPAWVPASELMRPKFEKRLADAIARELR